MGVKGFEGRNGLPAVVESEEDTRARIVFRRLHKASKENKGSVKKVMTALRVLKER